VKFSKEKAIEKIEIQISNIDSLSRQKRFNPEFKKWIRDTQIALEHIFGAESRHIKDFNQIKYSLNAYSSNTPDSTFQERYVKGLENSRAVLSSMIDEISEYWDDQVEDTENKYDMERTTKYNDPKTNEVFVIHGHDTGAKETMARFLTKLDLEPIILHEQPNKGRTIIEKFEDHANVSFAVALLTPDDIGASLSDSYNTQKRARQNVIFEFGYFIGRLGRKNVVGFIKDTIEVPSDYSGVLYIPLDSAGKWKFDLVKELKSAGYDIDANKAL